MYEHSHNGGEQHNHSEASPSGHSLHDDHDEIFPGESAEVVELLEDCRRAHAQGDSATIVQLTDKLLSMPLARCTDVVQMLRGDALFEQNRFDEAAESYRESIASGAEDYAMAWFKLGCSYAAEARFEEAAMAFWKAGELEPEQYMHRLQMGFALLELARFEDAKQVFEQVLEMSERRRGHYGLAWMYYSRAAESEEPARRQDIAQGFSALTEAVLAGELGEEGTADFPWWHAWINPAFESARGSEMLKAPLDLDWALLVSWPQEHGQPMILRDVLLDQPQWD